MKYGTIFSVRTPFRLPLFNHDFYSFLYKIFHLPKDLTYLNHLLHRFGPRTLSGTLRKQESDFNISQDNEVLDRTFTVLFLLPRPT